MLSDVGRQRLEKKKFRAFTLIELLVVVAIISVLAAILFPVFARARENARRASCMSNMKQIGLGMFMYMQDYDGMYMVSVSKDATGNILWPQFIQPYVKSLNLFNCPSFSKTTFTQGSSASAYYNSAASVPYGLNFWLLGEYYHLSEAGLQTPSETVLVAETGNSASSAATAGYFQCYPSYYGYTTPTNTQYGFQGNGAARLTDRHMDGLNILWADGHVKWMKRSVIEADVGSTTASKYWWGR
jgi:prepilin-type N-terminal cleavage/methylation domain-containing protein/prepilin-type processing-associated H-X9-DG protein